MEAGEFVSLAKNHPQFTFHQTPNWARLKADVGWKAYYTGLFEDDKCLGLAMLLARKIPCFNKYFFYSPRGFLIDYSDAELLKRFTEEIRKFAKEHKAIFVRMDPYLPYKERDKDGNIVKDGFDNTASFENIVSCGFKHKGFNIYFENLQPRWTSVLDLKNKTYEEIESHYMATLRKELRQNLRNGIYTREMKREELPEFIRLADSTGERKGYNTRPLSYYERMWDELYEDGYMKMSITFINFRKAREVSQSLIDEILENRRINEEKAARGEIKINPRKAETKKKEEDTAIANYKRNIEDFAKMEEEYGKEEIAVSALLCLLSPREMISMIIGNDERFMKYKASFSNYNWAIKYALDTGRERFNFYGITGDFSKDNPDYGLFEMKQRFGAVVEELVGQFDLVINPLFYALFKLYGKLSELKNH